MAKKEHYPYEYMDSFKKFEEEWLQSKEAFFSNLKEEGMSEKDYEVAKSWWKAQNPRGLSRRLLENGRGVSKRGSEVQKCVQGEVSPRPSPLSFSTWAELGRVI